MNFKITFHLDGTGLVYDPAEPIHLDGLIAWCLVPFSRTRSGLGKNDTPDDIELPLLKQQVNGEWVWQASALFPEGPVVESVKYWRKRFQQDRVELTSGSPNLASGAYRDYNMPLPVIHVLKMVAYASGNRKRTRKLLEKIRYLGKKRSYGFGKVTGIECEQIDHNWSLVKDGRSMRWLPHPNGTRLVRPRPPYFNKIGRVSCCEVGADLGMVREG